MVGKVGGGARVAEGEFEEVFGGGEEGNVWAVFGYVVGLDFFDGVEADEVEDVGEFGDEEVVGGVEEGFFEEWAVEEVVFVGVGLGEGVIAEAVSDVWAGVAAGDEFGVDFPFCVGEGEGVGGWASGVGGGGEWGDEAVDAGGGGGVGDG